jgi:hypothetical protein
MVRMVQTMHLSCTESSSISKRTERRFYMTHDTYEFHRVRPKWFPSLRYVRCKPCTYLESRLALYPNWQHLQNDWNEILHDSRHLGVPSGASKMIFEPVIRLVQTYLALRLTLSINGPKQDSTWPTSPRSSIGSVQNDFWAYGTFGANCGSILHRD